MELAANNTARGASRPGRSFASFHPLHPSRFNGLASAPVSARAQAPSLCPQSPAQGGRPNTIPGHLRSKRTNSPASSEIPRRCSHAGRAPFSPLSPVSPFTITLKSNNVRPNQGKSRLIKIFFHDPTAPFQDYLRSKRTNSSASSEIPRRCSHAGRSPFSPLSPVSPFSITLKSNNLQPNQGKSRLIKIFFHDPTAPFQDYLRSMRTSSPASSEIPRRCSHAGRAPFSPLSPVSPFSITLKSNDLQPNQGKSRLIKIFFHDPTAPFQDYLRSKRTNSPASSEIPRRCSHAGRAAFSPRSPVSPFSITLKSNDLQPNQGKSKLIKIFFHDPTAPFQDYLRSKKTNSPASSEIPRRWSHAGRSPFSPRSPVSPFSITLKSNNLQPNQGKSRLVKIFFMSPRGAILRRGQEILNNEVHWKSRFARNCS